MSESEADKKYVRRVIVPAAAATAAAATGAGPHPLSYHANCNMYRMTGADIFLSTACLPSQRPKCRDLNQCIAGRWLDAATTPAASLPLPLRQLRQPMDLSRMDYGQRQRYPNYRTRIFQRLISPRKYWIQSPVQVPYIFQKLRYFDVEILTSMH